MNNAGGGKVVGVKIFSRENGHELESRRTDADSNLRRTTP
jgi:hypothetical protein